MTMQKLSDQTEPGVPAGRVMETVGSELETLVRQCLDLQDAIGDALAADRGVDAAALQKLQAIDQVTQSLDNLAGFMRALSVQATQDWHVDAAAAAGQVTLADLADRLTERSPAETVANSTDESGECCLF